MIAVLIRFHRPVRTLQTSATIEALKAPSRKRTLLLAVTQYNPLEAHRRSVRQPMYTYDPEKSVGVVGRYRRGWINVLDDSLMSGHRSYYMLTLGRSFIWSQE
jgi:hypothetical protein